MILTILTIALALIWLGKETDWLRVRLLIGKDKPKVFAQYRAFNSLKKKKYYEVEVHAGSNADEPQGTMYTVVLDPGITDPICGWDWLDKHVADLVDYTPRVELQLAGIKYDMTIKPAGIEQGIMDKVMKVNKLSKQEKLKYSEVI